MTAEVSASIEVTPSELGTSLRTLRLCAPEADKHMQLSLSKLGQLTAVSAFSSGAGAPLEIFDGMKRWRAAQALSWPKLRVEVHALDAPGAKVRLLLCNQASVLCELEEAWLVRSLYREDGLSQPQIARLLWRHKSWVCRRLALAEDLSDELTASVRLGLVSATAAAELTRLQRCNQDVVGAVVARRGLTTRQTSRLVDALLLAPQEQWPTLLEQASSSAPAAPPAKAPRRTPGEQLVADAWAMKGLAVRLQTQLLARSIASFAEPHSSAVRSELGLLGATLRALQAILDARLGAQGAQDAAA